MIAEARKRRQRHAALSYINKAEVERVNNFIVMVITRIHPDKKTTTQKQLYCTEN